jgi:glycosyltransferase involved in cell wall biosynthesis
MKIAQIVPNWSQFHAKEAIGIKAVARDVTVGLIERGHEVTVFAPDDSTFADVKLEFCGPSLKDQGVGLMDPQSLDLQRQYALNIIPKLKGFDVIHSHIEHVLIPFLDQITTPVVSTIHGAGFQEQEINIFKKYPNGTFVALSKRATQVLPYIQFKTVVYNGIRIEDCPFVPVPEEESLGWMGRFSHTKGTLDAIRAAREAGQVITLVGFAQNGEDEYFNTVKQYVDGAKVRLLDKMIGHVKYAFLGNIRAFLFPIHWEEPFGLVMAEAMACGTPVIGFNHGSVSELVKDGVTGFVVEDEKDTNQTDKNTNSTNQATNLTNYNVNRSNFEWVIKQRGQAGLVEAIRRIGEIDRAACRKHVEDNFTTDRMIEGYLSVYKSVLASV